MTDAGTEQRRKYHRDYYAKNKSELQRKALKRAYDRYASFMCPKGDTQDVKTNGFTDK
jgi:hypothetical protein